MYAFNKRFRETTYVGVRVKPIIGFVIAVVSVLLGMMAFTAGKIAGMLFFAVLAVISIVFVVYEFAAGSDWRLRHIRAKAKRLASARQSMLRK
jgi:hypothetical protein